MSAAETIQLEGTVEQVDELRRAISISKTVLFTLGGESAETDSTIEKRISKLNYWEQVINLRLGK